MIMGDLNDQHISANTINIFMAPNNHTSRFEQTATQTKVIQPSTIDAYALMTAIGNLSDDIYLLLTPDFKIAYGSPQFWGSIGCNSDEKSNAVRSSKHLHRACVEHLHNMRNAQETISQTYHYKSWRTFSVTHRKNQISFQCTSIPLLDKKMFLGVLIHCKQECK